MLAVSVTRGDNRSIIISFSFPYPFLLLLTGGALARETKGSVDIGFSNNSNLFDRLIENKEILNGIQNARTDCWPESMKQL